MFLAAVPASEGVAEGVAMGVVEGDTDNPVAAAPSVSRPATHSCQVTLADKFLSNATDGSQRFYSGTLAPPKSCPGPWAKVVLDQTITVSGRQYDRIGDLDIGGTEVYWGTTEEPSGEGKRAITYHFDKDVTRYSALLRTPQPFKGGIGNYTSSVYTGIYAQTVTLTYYQADRHTPAAEVADHVAGFPHQDANAGAGTVHFKLEDLPRNITRAYLEVTLEGGACDEQWFDAVPDTVSARYPAAGLCGHGPFREANAALDGVAVAGVHTFPHIYSGGIVPTLWRPVVAIGTFSLLAETVDVTPFAGTLVDGKSHDLSFDIANIGGSWSVSPTLLLFTDKGATRTSGALTRHDVAPVAAQKTAEKEISGGVNATVTARRDDVTAGYVDTSAGRVYTRVERTRDYRNSGDITGNGFVQHVAQTDAGQQTSVSTVDGRVGAADRHSWSYPLTVDSSAADFVDDQNFKLTGTVEMTQILGDETGDGRHWRPVAGSREWLRSTGVLARTNGVNTESDGSSRTLFTGTDDRGRPYFHEIATEHGLVTRDRQFPLH
ncbi:peptide-N4-asparagine amidase [Amycolatopsis sp. H20-H5]|nr:peptide-N4-asparagine amidase [Amycolatopsis sp. H20-H5]MEC3976084.1 peptide-N4-asparagine amidase [Amycolatopsis sp. H20-H5]